MAQKTGYPKDLLDPASTWRPTSASTPSSKPSCSAPSAKPTTCPPRKASRSRTTRRSPRSRVTCSPAWAGPVAPRRRQGQATDAPSAPRPTPHAGLSGLGVGPKAAPRQRRPASLDEAAVLAEGHPACRRQDRLPRRHARARPRHGGRPRHRHREASRTVRRGPHRLRHPDAGGPAHQGLPDAAQGGGLRPQVRARGDRDDPTRGARGDHGSRFRAFRDLRVKRDRPPRPTLRPQALPKQANPMPARPRPRPRRRRRRLDRRPRASRLEPTTSSTARCPVGLVALAPRPAPRRPAPRRRVFDAAKVARTPPRQRLRRSSSRARTARTA